MSCRPVRCARSDRRRGVSALGRSSLALSCSLTHARSLLRRLPQTSSGRSSTLDRQRARITTRSSTPCSLGPFRAGRTSLFSQCVRGHGAAGTATAPRAERRPRVLPSLPLPFPFALALTRPSSFRHARTHARARRFHAMPPRGVVSRSDSPTSSLCLRPAVPLSRRTLRIRRTFQNCSA